MSSLIRVYTVYVYNSGLYAGINEGGVIIAGGGEVWRGGVC